MELWIQAGSSLKKPLKSLLLKVPMLCSAAVMSREILLLLPSPPVPVAIQRDWEAAEGLLFVSRTPRTQRGIFRGAIPRPSNGYGCIPRMCQADAISSSCLCRFSSPPSQSISLTCAVPLLCTAAASSDAYLKPGHGGQMEYYFIFFSPLNTW